MCGFNADVMRKCVLDEAYTFNGEKIGAKKQTLFWDEIKYEIPQKPKIELKENTYYIDLAYNKVFYNNDYDYNYALRCLFRNDKETGKKALKQIKRFTRLLALRDQECPNSRGYEFIESKNNWTIKKDLAEEYDKQYFTSVTDYYYFPDRVYFKTEEDAQKICDILNCNRFDLEEE